ncbi:Electron transfer flavoprotein subunit beta [Wickerhamomyces ciferrii]|uniref:Probable electron transfer flavoprotein subunit beta n=1 Tax=Wickerhamomyces ciferrii (strain ATCC 14091 / BCRC 22168 / CBS 111 / JCM 3599 / NBRC 0793 / NRRL Y-1031 F-60-10) TaxID=1206466 RepID=K0KNG4_WICCF|nr:Electron transfer flavoprotein subunit beta [Wickerhamomyces ciferrii]CCH42668.1 Electron transfer flavoprotein subunit beta [Wickerhamomyces ciferrii]
MSSKLNILVPVKRVIDFAIKPRINKTNTGIEKTGVKFSINPFCDIAVTKGADSSTLVDVGEEEIEPLSVAKILKQVVEKNQSNLVILGKQAIDDDSNHTGQMLAGLLNWPQATNAAKVEIKNDEVFVTREIDGGEETVKSKLPLIITTDLRLNEPRYATLPNMMKAKKKPLEKLKLSDFDVDVTKRIEVLKVEEPPVRNAGIKVGNVDELVSKLKDLKAI